MAKIAGRLVMMAVALLVAAGCVGKGKNAPQPREETTVQVDNQSWADVTMYAVRGTARTRLGLVNANSRATFRIPDHVVGIGANLVFLADPVGSGTVSTSFERHVRAGDQITLTLPPRVGRP